MSSTEEHVMTAAPETIDHMIIVYNQYEGSRQERDDNLTVVKALFITTFSTCIVTAKIKI